ncbi:hypothetical protein [Mesorhizobium sp. M0491]|uniref:tetratricopeptide repeat protein n=1 Tax=Mesorhizobium sp. M0491 TaxID=2956950 RepID=UPI003337A7F9
MSDDDTHLVQAKEALHKGEVEKAISILLDAMNYESKKAAAAYSLGIVYDSNTDCHDDDMALSYYSIAESGGIEMATYRIAGLKQRIGDNIESLELFKKISTRNPSAAYWCYRLIQKNEPTDPDAEIFLKSAASQGHILAKRDILMEKLKGRRGAAQMVIGAFGMIRLFRETMAAYAARDELLYQ